LDKYGGIATTRPALLRHLVRDAMVLGAGALLMLARTSPALAADTGQGQV
jgi:hypothetical protein